MHALHIVVEDPDQDGPRRRTQTGGRASSAAAKFASLVRKSRKFTPNGFAVAARMAAIRSPISAALWPVTPRVPSPPVFETSRYQRHRGAGCHPTQDNGMSNAQKVTHRRMNHYVSPHRSVHHPDCRVLLFA